MQNGDSRDLPVIITGAIACVCLKMADLKLCDLTDLSVRLVVLTIICLLFLIYRGFPTRMVYLEHDI